MLSVKVATLFSEHGCEHTQKPFKLNVKTLTTKFILNPVCWSQTITEQINMSCTGNTLLLRENATTGWQGI